MRVVMHSIGIKIQGDKDCFVIINVSEIAKVVKNQMLIISMVWEKLILVRLLLKLQTAVNQMIAAVFSAFA